MPINSHLNTVRLYKPPNCVFFLYEFSTLHRVDNQRCKEIFQLLVFLSGIILPAFLVRVD